MRFNIGFRQLAGRFVDNAHLLMMGRCNLASRMQYQTSHIMKHVETPSGRAFDAVDSRSGQAHSNLPPAKLILQTLLVAKVSGQSSVGHQDRDIRRSPKDRFLVNNAVTADRVDWGDINQPMTSRRSALLQDVQSHLRKERPRQGRCVGSDKRQVPVRVVAEKAWSSLFVDNMFIRLTDEELWW